MVDRKELVRICLHTGYSYAHLFRTRRVRRKELVLARFLVMREVYRQQGSLKDTAFVFRQTHSNVLYGNRELAFIEEKRYPEWAYHRIRSFTASISVSPHTLGRLKRKYCDRWRMDRFLSLISELKQYIDEEESISP